MLITIRRFQAEEAETVSRLMIDDLAHVNIRDYGVEVVEQLARYSTPEFIEQFAAQGEMYVALDGAELVGTATLEQERVRNVFVRRDYHRRGVGAQLMHHIEAVARQRGLSRVFLWANIAAVDFYTRLGYLITGTKEEEIGGVPLKTTLMEKMLG